MRTRARAIGLVLVGLLGPLLLVACGGGASTTSTTPPNSPPAAPATASIGPAGGTLTSADGVVTLKVPKGALSHTVTLGIAPATKAPSGALLAYELTPSGTAFAVPATLTVDTSALSFPTGSTEADVRIETASSGAWKGLYTTLDAGKHTASASLAHLSTYGVLALPLSSTLVMGWLAGKPIVSAEAAGSTAYELKQKTVLQPVASEAPPAAAPVPVAPSCLFWSWLDQLTYYDVGGFHQWTVSAGAPAVPLPASAGEAFSVGGSGASFTIASTLRAQTDPNGWAYVGHTSTADTGTIGPFIIAEIDNPDGAPRTLSLHWTSRGDFNGLSPYGYDVNQQVEIDYQNVDGSCGAVPNGVVYLQGALPGTGTDTTESFAIPTGAAKIWVNVASYATFDVDNPPANVTYKGSVDSALDLQVE